MTRQQGYKIAALDNQEFAIFDCYRIRGPLAAIEKCNFSKYLSGHNQIENCILSLLGRRTDSDRAGANGIKTCSDVVFTKDDPALLYFPHIGTESQPVDRCVVHFFEKRMSAKQGALIERP